MRYIIPLFIVSFCFFSPKSKAAITTLDGVSTTPLDPLVSIQSFTIDILIDFVDFSTAPAGTKYSIFESGGDGDGVALWLDIDAQSLVFYQDHGDFSTSTPTVDTSYSVNISSFSNSAAVIRLQNDYSSTTDTSALFVTNGSLTTSSGVQILNEDDVDGVGNGDTALGTIAGTVAGEDENTFVFTDYPVPSGGNLTAIIYDTNSATMPPPTALPTPEAFPAPEPTSSLLALCGCLSLLVRRRHT